MTTRLADDAVSIAARLKEIEAERTAALTNPTQPREPYVETESYTHLPPLEPWDYAP